MSYEPLHHKYRPQTFTDLVGQDAIAQTLTNALSQRKIAPAYLFTGPRGTGKTSSARILAKSLNCLTSQVPTAHPCGQCDVCRGITKGATLDVIEIDAASNTGVDNIRDLIERAQFAPVQCRYKVYVIDECHMLSTAAFNALLKTLEEPPDRVIFVLATTDPQRVLPTIISRCQRFDFRRIPLQAMIKHLRKIATEENINITDESITLVAQIAQGGLRDAESLLDQLSLLQDGITIEKVWDLVGAVPEKDLMSLLKAIHSDEIEHLLDIARRLMDRGREPLIVLQNLASFYRDLLIAKTAPNRHNLVAMTPPTWQELCQFAKGCDLSLILSGQKLLKESEVQVKNTTQPRLWLEMTLLSLLPSAVNLNHAPIVTESQPQKTTTVSQSPAEKYQPAPPHPVTHTPVEPPYIPSENIPKSTAITPDTSKQLDSLPEIWEALLNHVKQSTRTNLELSGKLAKFDGQAAIIYIGSATKLKMIKKPDIELALETIFQRKIKVVLELRAFDTNTLPSVDIPTEEPPTPIKSTPKPPEKTDKLSPIDEDAKLVNELAHTVAKEFNGEIIDLPPKSKSPSVNSIETHPKEEKKVEYVKPIITEDEVFLDEGEDSEEDDDEIDF